MKFSRAELESFYRYCVALIHDEELAYDLLQTTLEKWLRGNFHARISHPRAYFMRMIKTQFLDDLRKEKDIEMVSLDEETIIPQIGGRSLEDILITEEELKKVLQLMNAEEREMLFLWAVEEFTIQEVANYLDLPKGTVLARMFRLKKRIQNIFDFSKEGRRQ